MRKNDKFAIIFAFFTLFSLIFAFFQKTNFSFAQAESKPSYKAMAVIEKESGRVLNAYNEDERLPMASTTKIITAIYVIEHVGDLNREFTIPKEATGIEGTSIGLKEGEHLTIRELLYGLMLRSGNDSAVALAIATSGSEEKFVEDVNDYLHAAGYEDTHLMNPHGLPAEDHYTSARELAKITAHALKNPEFAKIVSTKQHTIRNELKSKFSRNLKNKNRMLSEFEGADGVKTGYTKKAGRCFVGSATRDGMQLVCVLLNCGPMFEECQRLLDNSFKEYKLCRLVSAGQQVSEAKVEHGEVESVKALVKNDLYYPLSEDERGKVKMKVNIDDAEAPLKVGDEIGQIEVYLEKQLIFSEKIYNIEEVEQKGISPQLDKIIEKF